MFKETGLVIEEKSKQDKNVIFFNYKLFSSERKLYMRFTMSTFSRISSSLHEMPNRRKIIISCCCLFSGFLIFFVFNIKSPATLNYDEYHYIPSARQFIQMTDNQNHEHPPLAKELIAIGIVLAGDGPVGWRIMSTIFGALTVIGLYLAALALFRNQLSALFVAFMSGFNNLLYVQARIAMLDTFMVAFIVLALGLGLCALFPLKTSPSDSHRSNHVRLLNASGIMMGAAIACKWFAIVPWVGIWALLFVYRFLSYWNISIGKEPIPTSLSTFYPLEQITCFKKWDFVRSWLLLPLITYYLTFLPFLFISPEENESTYSLTDILFAFQENMWNRQISLSAFHSFLSGWAEWPLMLRPIWYYFKMDPDRRWFQGVVFLGNPFVLWGGILALLYTGWDFFRTRSFSAFWILFSYGLFYFSWIVIPRKITFFYYYYPAALVFSFAWAYLLFRISPKKISLWVHSFILTLTLGFFIHFFPLLGAIATPHAELEGWLWLEGWF